MHSNRHTHTLLLTILPLRIDRRAACSLATLIPCTECRCCLTAVVWEEDDGGGGCGDDNLRDATVPTVCCSKLLDDEAVNEDLLNGLLGVNAVINFSIRRSRSSIRSIAWWSSALLLFPPPAAKDVDDVDGDPDVAAAAAAAAACCWAWACAWARLRRSELLLHSKPALTQYAQGLPPSHFVLRRRQVSQAEPELRRRALFVVKTLRE